MMPERILLVGGSGYLGRYLQKSLVQKGHQVVITGTKTLNRESYFRIDFNEPETFESLNTEVFNLIVILASKLESIGSQDLSHSDLETNVLGLGRFLDFIKDTMLSPKVVYVSSMTVYAQENVSPVHEGMARRPLSSYGLSKKIAEDMTSFFCRSSGVKGLILRLPGIYGGSRQAGFIYSTIQKIKTGEKVILNTSGLGYWETIHVDDLVTMMTDLFTEYDWNERVDTFNMSYGEESDFNSTAMYIAQRMGKPGVVEFLNKKEYVKFYMDNEKLKSIINKPSKLSTSLTQYIDSFL